MRAPFPNSGWQLRLLHHDPSAFCQANLGGKCAQARLVQLGRKNCPIPCTKISLIKTGIFGRMERALDMSRVAHQARAYS